MSKVSPKAKATPAKPIPRFGKAAAKTALPQPPNTSQNVPKNSAKQRLLRVTNTSARTVSAYSDCAEGLDQNKMPLIANIYRSVVFSGIGKLVSQTHVSAQQFWALFFNR